MPHVELRDGHRLHYWDVGRGPPCILLHGFGMQAWMWLPTVAPLTRRWRFILPDLRGFGRSHHLPITRDNALHQYADDLEDLIEGLQLDGCALAGLSMGACTSLEYHRRYSFERVRAYLNIDNPPCVSAKPGWPWGLFGERHLEFRTPVRELLAEFDEHPHPTAFHELPAALRARFWQQFADFGAQAFENPLLQRLVRASGSFPLMQRLADTTHWRVYGQLIRSFTENDYDWRGTVGRKPAPLFRVFAGTQSRMYALEGQLHFSKLVPHAQIVRFEKAGHCIQFDQPTRFLRELERFLEDAYLPYVRVHPQERARA